MRKTITRAIFSNQFTRHVGNGQKTWQTIDNVLNRKPPKSTPDTISIDSKLCTNKKDRANEFNNYFATICANNQIPDMNTHYTSYLNTPIESTFNFEHIDNATTMHHLSKLTPSNSYGHDNLSAITLKSIANEICECITLIINQSITTGIFSDQLKVAKVVPIFKKNDQSDIKSYRPISVLPTISKLFENVMQTQLMEYFTSHNLLASQQFGFMSNRSTELAALELMDRHVKVQLGPRYEGQLNPMAEPIPHEVRPLVRTHVYHPYHAADRQAETDSITDADAFSHRFMVAV